MYQSYQPPPPKRRPRALWWVVAVVITVVIPAAMTAPFVTTMVRYADEDAVFTADGELRTIALDGSEDRMLFARLGAAPQCEVEGETLRRPTGSYNFNEWYAFAELTSPPSSIEIRCTSAGGEDVRIGPSMSVTGLGGSIALMVAGIFVGIGGIAFLIVLLVLTLSRPKNPPTGQPGQQPGGYWQPPGPTPSR